MTCGILHSVPLGSGAAGSGSEGESEDARNVAPPGAAFGPSWRQRWWDYRNHPAAPRRAGTQRLQTTSWSHTPSHTDTRAHANECMFEYVYKGGGEGLDEPVTGVEWWHFCGISCLSLNICDTRLALEGCAVCLSGCVCVCGWRAFETRSEKGPADKQTSNKGTFSISSSSVYMPTHKAVGHAGSHSTSSQ